MKNIITAIVLLCAALFAGCANAAKLNDLHTGMTKDQVIAVMGQPDSTSAQANIEYLTYYLSDDRSSSSYPAFSSGNRGYMVRLVDGKVESFGRYNQLFDIYNRPPGAIPTQMPIGATMLGGPSVPLSMVRTSAPDLATSLAKLKALKDQGALTDKEFQAAKLEALKEHGALTDEEFQKEKAKLLSDQK